MAANIGASLPAAPPAAAEPTLAADAPSSRTGASLPSRPPAAAAAAAAAAASSAGGASAAAATGGGDDDDDDDDEEAVGPPLPPGVGAAGGGEEEEVVHGPSLPPGLDAAPPAAPSDDEDDARHYNPTDMSQQVFGAAEADDDDDDEDLDKPVQVPVSHQIALKAHSKTVTCLALDPSGSRLVTGSSDHDLYFWDFAGMTRELKPFRHLEEPLGSFQLRSIGYSPTADRIIVAGASNQPCIFDRDGRKLTTLMKGDMYIRDMRSTKGHVAACTAAAWHVHDRGTVTTAGEDGTVRRAVTLCPTPSPLPLPLPLGLHPGH